MAQRCADGEIEYGHSSAHGQRWAYPAERPDVSSLCIDQAFLSAHWALRRFPTHFANADLNS
jgi:hypothetical protein